MRFAEWVDTVRQDASIAFRSFARNPAFTVTAVLTLALGMGASTALFSLVNSAMLARFPFEDADRIVVVYGVAGPERLRRGASYPEAQDWRAGTRTVDRLSTYDEAIVNLSGRGAATQLQAEIVSPTYFELLGAKASLGRTLIPDDDRPNVSPSAVISDDLWRTRFGGDPAIVGQQITLDARPATIVGVMPPGFRGISFDTQIWTALLPFDAESGTARGSHWLLALARLRDGVSIDAAQADFESLTERLEQEYPEFNRGQRADVMSLRTFYLDDTRTLLLVLLGCVGFLLLIACANVTNLQLVRGLARAREIAVRTALGAGRGRVVRQLLTESVVLAIAGGLGGLALAYWGLRAVLPQVPDGVLPRYFAAQVDARLLLFALGLVMVTAMIAGLVPALRATRGALATELRAQPATLAGRSGRLQQAIVASEMALALALLAGAGLMIRSLQAQLHIDPGFRADHILVARVSLPQQGIYDEREERLRFTNALQEAVRGRVGASRFAFASAAPLRGYTMAANIERDDRPDSGIRYYRHQVTPEYFETLGIDVVKGRAFERTDDLEARRVAVVSETFAARMWPGEDPLGRVLRLGTPEAPAVTVVGVARDVHHRNLTTQLTDAAEDPDVYLAFMQFPPLNFDVVVREPRPGVVTARTIREAVSAADPTIPIFHVETLAGSLSAQTSDARFGTFVLGLFALLALTLAAVGLYGVISFMVSARRRELAIRLALGANPSVLVRKVLATGMSVAAIGAVAGLLGAVAGTRLLASFLYGVAPTDPVTLAGVSLLLLATAGAANLIPAVRAARIDPQIALHAE